MSDLNGASVYILGRFGGLSRHRIRGMLRGSAARLAPRLTGGVNLAVVGHSTANTLLSSSRVMDVMEAVPSGAELMSEVAFQRVLGLAPPLPDEPRTLSVDDMARLSGIEADLLFWLALYDVIEPVNDRYAWRDLVSAREVARLLDAGAGFVAIISAAVTLRRMGERLCEARLMVGPHGRILRAMDGEVLELDGQYALDLGDREIDIESLLMRAEEAEMEEDFDYAERLYRIALKLDPLNPLTAFNLGNAVDAQERKTEARHFWHLALEIDPWLPEACFNLALAAEEAKDYAGAVALYRRALAADGDYADAAYNLGMLLYEQERYAEALPMWERFIRLDPNAREAIIARRHAAECRLRARMAGAGRTA